MSFFKMTITDKKKKKARGKQTPFMQEFEQKIQIANDIFLSIHKEMLFNKLLYDYHNSKN
jgi:hypothetical protein